MFKLKFQIYLCIYEKLKFIFILKNIKISKLDFSFIMFKRQNESPFRLHSFN